MPLCASLQEARRLLEARLEKAGLRTLIPGEAATLMHGYRITPVDLQETANRQIGIEVIDRLGGAVEQRCDTAGCDHRHGLVPLRLDACDHALDEGHVTPENAGTAWR